jgi:ribonucleoside-diphosphate reductase alpha chain
MMGNAVAVSPLSRMIWEQRYRYGGEADIQETWSRVARAVAAAEPRDTESWGRRYFDLLASKRFLAGGRILAGAGTDRRVTLFNCFVMGAIEDSMAGICRALEEGALTMQQGGGVGYDFSTLRPRGASARASGQVASGPVSFMGVWNSMCATLQTTSERRGAMMATLRCDHPDIEELIDAKRTNASSLSCFNLSVLVTDAFVQAVDAGAELPLTFDGEVARRVPARDLWRRLLEAAADIGEPGILFVDQVNRVNNLWYRERITATNPCGEVPLPAYGACNLGSLNLPLFVRQPFTPEATFDFDALAEAASLAVRFLDDVVDVSGFPLPAQADEARATRRLGLGITGLGSALVMLGRRYDSEEARALAADIARTLAHAAYRASIGLAKERGAFPVFESANYLRGQYVRTLPDDIRRALQRSGIRNSHLVAFAPAGTISLLADNVSSGIEPIFRGTYRRRVRRAGGARTEIDIVDYAVTSWRQRSASAGSLPPAFTDARAIAPAAHVEMQAALQPFVDGAISKTVNLPAGATADDVRHLMDRAYAVGLKGLTVFPAGSPIGEVLIADGPEAGGGCDAPTCAAL